MDICWSLIEQKFDTGTIDAEMPTYNVWLCVTRYLMFTHGLTAAILLHTVIKEQ